MNDLSLIAIMLALWAVATRSGSVVRLWAARFSPSSAAARSAAAALVLLYGGQLTLVLLDSRLASASSTFGWMKTLPLPVFDDRVPHQPFFASAGLGLGFLETVALAIVMLSLRHDAHALTNRWIVGSGVAFALLSLFWPVMSTTDPYEYAATGMLGMHAYFPAAGAFDGTIYEAIQHVVPLKGVIYGPLWVMVDTLQTGWLPSIYAKLEALRLTNAALIAVLLALLRKAGLPRTALACIAINPFVWCYCVETPHAEIEGVTFLAVAYGLLLRAKKWPAFFWIVAAGLIKMPFVIVGGSLFVALAGRSRRSALWCAAIATALALSYFIPGPAYLTSLSKFAIHRAAGPWYSGWLFAASLVAFGLIALVAFGRKAFGVAWLCQQMSPLAAPWYLLWGIPYALATGSVASYMVSLPLAGYVLDEYTRHESGSAYVVLFVGLTLGVDLYATTNGRRTRAAPARL